MKYFYPIRYLFLLLFLLCMTTALQAQQRTITGKVTSAEDGIGLPGVNIRVKGTSQGTVTDLNGNFRIEASSNDVLVFSFVGYMEQELPVGNRSVIDVKLAEDVETLSEVVVVGYGQQEKKDVTGAVAVLDPKEFNPGVINSPEQLMQGKVAGVQIFTNSGAPGAGATVRIRGANSIRANNDPLYVIDGVPLLGSATSPASVDIGAGVAGGEAINPLNFLNPADIESITILKDASATAIYGSRGANGVVMITTKKGANIEPSLSYNTYVGVANIREKLDLLSASEFIEAQRKIATELNRNPDEQLSGKDLGASTDWQDEIFQTAISHNHNISLSGGTTSTGYFGSLSYLEQEGIIEGSDLQRVTGRINLTQKALNERLSLNINVTPSYLKVKSAPVGATGGAEGDVITNALRENPTFPVKRNGQYFYTISSSERNPKAMVDLYFDEQETLRTLANISTDFKIFEGLNYKINIGLDYASSQRTIFLPAFLTDTIFRNTTNGSAYINNLTSNGGLIEHFVTYNKELGDLKLNLLAGYSYQRFSIFTVTNGRQGFGNISLNGVRSLSSGGTPVTPTSNRRISELQSYFGRANFGYKDKYVLTATLRADGSTRFGANNRYGYFPSFAAKWRILEEDFMAQIGIFSDLGIRAGWGITGNQEIPDYLYLPVLGTDPSTIGFLNGNPDVSTSGLTYLQTPNPDLKWEETEQLNIGIDFGFFQNRLTGSAEYYYKNTTDLLFFQKSQGGGEITNRTWQNLNANLINKGFEVTLSSVNYDNENFKWNTSLNFAKLDNKIKNLAFTAPTGNVSGPGLSGTPAQILRNEWPINSFYGPQFLGYDTDGFATYLDSNNDGNPDNVFLGKPLPNYTFGVNNNFTYRKFDLTLFINGAFGDYFVFNNTANAIFSRASLSNGNNVTEDVANSPESPLNSVIYSSRYIEDASFVRLNNLTVGYNFGTENVGWVKQLRGYITGTNLLLLTDYSGYDPEVNTDANRDGIPSVGIDYTNYPRPRTFLLGLNVTF